MARPTKEEIEKRELARKKVDEILGSDINIDVKNITAVADKLVKLEAKGLDGETGETSSKGNEWLEKEMERLTIENKRLEDKLVDATKLLNSKGTDTTSPKGLEVGIRKIFDELRHNYEGNNARKIKYQQANIKPLLEKFLQTFEFLRKK